MEQIYPKKERIFDVRELCHVLFKKIWLLLLVGLLSAIVLFYLSVYVIEWKYESTTKLYILSKQDSTSEITYSDLQISSQLIKDYMALITSRLVTEQVIHELALPMKHEELIQLIHLDNPDETRILAITVTCSDPVLAKQIADHLRIAATNVITSFNDFEHVSKIEEAKQREKATTPNVSFNTLLGAAMGVLLSSAYLILRYIQNDTLKKQEEIEESLGLTLLGKVLLHKKYKNSLLHEDYLNLSSNLQFFGKGMKIIGITTSKFDEARYECAYHLAVTMAKMGKKTIFINANIKDNSSENFKYLFFKFLNKKYRKSKLMNAKAMTRKNIGLSNYLTICSIEEIIQKSEDENLQVIHSGTISGNPFELLSSCKFGGLLEELSYHYDYVVVFSPPLDFTNEGFIVAKKCEGIVLLIHGNEDRYDNIHKVVLRLEKIECKMIGAVLLQGR